MGSTPDDASLTAPYRPGCRPCASDSLHPGKLVGRRRKTDDRKGWLMPRLSWSKGALVALLAGLLLLGSTSMAIAGSSSTTLPNGAQLAVSIDDPVTSTEFVIPTGQASRSVQVSGTASVGLGNPDATFIYVIDGSGSTAGGSGTGCAPVLACEKVFVIALNSAAIADGSVDEVGVVVFGAGGVTADMSPAAGDQLITAPNAGPGNVATVVNSATSAGGVGQFTAKSSGGGATNFTAGLQAALTVVNASSNSKKIVVFLSDGGSNAGAAGFNAAVSALATAGATVQTIAVGSGSTCTAGTAGTLQQIAAGTGGQCREIVDPGALPNIIPNLISSTLQSLDISVDGGASTPIGNADITPDLPQPGAVSVNYSTTVAGLTPGDHVICVTAHGSDAAGTGSVTQCETIHLFQLSLAPAAAVNELGTPGQTHTVTATLAGPNTVASSNVGRTINFTILSGPNAGKAGLGTTDAAGQATFTYTAVQGPAGLGTDVIQACFTARVPTGETGCTTVTKTWRDTTPPVGACTPTTNPSGGNVPPAGDNPNSGQNPDGFYELTATDAVDPNPQIFVHDSDSSAVFGPFASGTKIKLTQAPGKTPTQKPGAGVIDWHITLKGDALLFATDASGNVAGPISCKVPPPPK